jgi:single-strand DNA-binding protein
MSYRSINRVVLVGRLTRDPELRELPSGQSVCDLRLACTSLRREEDGSYGERPCYFTVNAFGAQAQVVARYMRKGSAIAVDGRLEWREWESAEHGMRQAVEVVAESVQFLDRPSSQSGHDGVGGADGSGSHDELREGAGEREVELVF